MTTSCNSKAVSINFLEYVAFPPRIMSYSLLVGLHVRTRNIKAYSTIQDREHAEVWGNRPYAMYKKRLEDAEWVDQEEAFRKLRDWEW